MKKLAKLVVGSIAMTVLLVASNKAAVATPIDITVVNPGFEQPGTGKITSGFDAAGSDIPGWSNGASGTYGDTGVEAWSHSGSYAAFLCTGDPSGGDVVQLTGHQIQSGETFTLNYWTMLVTWEGNPAAGIANAALYYIDNNGVKQRLNTTLSNSDIDDANVWLERTVTATATPDSVGKYIGIEFWAGSTYPHFDDVSLTYTPIPEPTSMTLLGLGGLSLLAYAWRKRK